MSLDFNDILVLDEEEIFAKPEDEVADVIHNLILQHSLVHVFNVIGILFLHVDEVQQVFIFESTDGAACAPYIWNGGKEIVG